MVCGVELRFDADLTAQIGALRQAYVPGSGAQGGAIPHLSLAVYDDLEEDELATIADMLDALASRWRPLRIELASLGVFPTEENVLFLAPVVTQDLLATHAAYHRLAAGLRASCWPHYLPDAWVPHCTLAMFWPSAALLAILEQLKATWKPLSGTAQSLALIRVEPLGPPETLHEVPFASRPA